MGIKSYFLGLILIFFTGKTGNSIAEEFNMPAPVVSTVYARMNLGSAGLDIAVFEKAFERWQALREQTTVSSILAIADLSLSSVSKRLYIMDLEKEEMLFNTYVAHGRNSGDEYATSFSNQPSSYKSSLGFYLTGDTYEGKHGLSLRLYGLDKGINDFAETRAVVMHGADYVSESFIKQIGRLGRSQGCPSVSKELSAPIINTIKNRSCLFIYHPQYSK